MLQAERVCYGDLPPWAFLADGQIDPSYITQITRVIEVRIAHEAEIAAERHHPAYTFFHSFREEW